MTPRARAEELFARLRAEGRRIVFTNGCFDILHAGHARYLLAASRLGDVLVVGLNGDSSVRRLKGEGRPVQRQGDRAYLLASLACVSHVVVFGEDTPEKLIRSVRPHVLVKGADWKGKEVAGAGFVRASGGEIRFLPFLAGRSTTAIIDRTRSSPEREGKGAPMTTKLEELAREIDSVRAETLEILGKIPEERFRVGKRGEWSPAEQFEHLLLSEASVGRVVRKVLRETEGELPPYPADDAHFAVLRKVTFAGMESPDVVIPEGVHSREALLAREEDIRTDTRATFSRLAKVDPTAAHFLHPRFGPLNLYEWPAVVILAHERAHQDQLRKALRGSPRRK